jgi:ribose 5-phosphate isomerase B
MKIALGNDHAGYPMKKEVIEVLRSLGVEVIDFGSYDPEKVDFPDIARKVCDAVRQGQADRGIMVCGTGVGASICHDIHCAHQCVEHDDVNVMCIGAQIVGPWLVRDLIPAFIRARFSTDEDCRRRVRKLHELELEAARELKDKIG